VDSAQKESESRFSQPLVYITWEKRENGIFFTPDKQIYL